MAGLAAAAFTISSQERLKVKGAQLPHPDLRSVPLCCGVEPRQPGNRITRLKFVKGRDRSGSLLSSSESITALTRGASWGRRPGSCSSVRAETGDFHHSSHYAKEIFAPAIGRELRDRQAKPNARERLLGVNLLLTSSPWQSILRSGARPLRAPGSLPGLPAGSISKPKHLQVGGLNGFAN